MEIKPNKPFRSPETFEENMQNAVLIIQDFLEKNYAAHLLGTGMHPTLKLEETKIWPHRDRRIYQAFGKLFNLKQHGWLNIQSFQLNIPYYNEERAIYLHNLLANICPYLPAITASSPIYEEKIGNHVDNRLYFYMTTQEKIPSITGDLIPEYIYSSNQYKKEIIEKYTLDLSLAGADECLLHKDWVNSRGIILRFDRKAIEIRVMDEQECIKSDVAISCFVRALLRGLITKNENQFLPHNILVEDFKAVIKQGLKAKVSHPKGPTAQHVCNYFYHVAWENATQEEKKYLPIVEKRIQKGSLSDIIRTAVKKKAQKTDFQEAIRKVYQKLMKHLRNNTPFI